MDTKATSPAALARSGHLDSFARDNLPPREQWPEFVFDLPELQYPPRFNAAVELLAGGIARGFGARTAIAAPAMPPMPGASDASGASAAGERLRRWSYQALDEWSDRIARVLVEDMGVVPGNRVLLRGPNSPAMAACWFAVVKAGAIAVATMPLLRARELRAVIDKARVSHALCDARLADELDAAMEGLAQPLVQRHFANDGGGSLDVAAMAKPAGFMPADTAADDVAMIAFTSGTTGAPKGTMHFHRDILAACDCWPPHVLRAGADDVFTGSPPLAFTFGLGGLLLFPLRIGAATLLLEKASPEALLEAIARHRPTVLFTAPTSYRAMAARAKEFDLSSLAKCVSAGEALPAATRTLWKQATGIDIIDGIGSTELLHIFISHREDESRGGATGRAVPGYRARVIDEQGRTLPPGNVGRLAVKGPTGCRYLADERQRNYVQDGWNLTGDAYLVDDDGYFVYQARTDDMIISAGYNIAGPEVEGALMLHPDVAECGVIGLPDEERGQVVAAFVVMKPGRARDEAKAAELRDFVKRTIAPYKYPRRLRFVDALPRTETGKLQRFRLKDL